MSLDDYTEQYRGISPETRSPSSQPKRLNHQPLVLEVAKQTHVKIQSLWSVKVWNGMNGHNVRPDSASRAGSFDAGSSPPSAGGS